MIPERVNIIVKAPNQQIDDQNIYCESSWTVKQLKSHLSEVYPTKPRTDEQKIIYFGQLLEDNTVLKDVLRTYESQLGHTMHLVCASKYRAPTVKPIHSAPTEPLTDGLRHRYMQPNQPFQMPRPSEIPRPETRQNDQNHSVEMRNYMNSVANSAGRVPYQIYNTTYGEYMQMADNPAAMANHMMLLQQAYMQYMQQFHGTMWEQNDPITSGSAPTPNQGNEAPTQPLQPEVAPAAPEDPEEVHRDWLDHIYAASRLAVLFSLVYLYSSPFRLLLVVLLAAAGYLHQVGFFRDLAVNARPQEPILRENQPINPQPDQPINPQPDQPINIQPDQPIRAAVAEEIRQNPVNNATNDNQQSLLAVTWMIFTSFFASLIPEMNQ